MTASGVVDLDAARRDLERLRRQIDQLAEHLTRRGGDEGSSRTAA